MEWENLKSRNHFYMEMGAFSMGTVEIYDEQKQNLLLYAKSRLIKWKGLKVFSDKEMQHEMLSIIQDFELIKNAKSFKERLGAVYLVTDIRQGQKIGYVKYFLKSIWSTNYNLLDMNQQVIGSIEQVGKIFASRMIAFVQPEFEIRIQGRVVAHLKGRFAWYKKKFDLEIVDNSVDIRQILTMAILVLGMEKVKSAY